MNHKILENLNPQLTVEADLQNKFLSVGKLLKLSAKGYLFQMINAERVALESNKPAFWIGDAVQKKVLHGLQANTIEREVIVKLTDTPEEYFHSEDVELKGSIDHISFNENGDDRLHLTEVKYSNESTKREQACVQLHAYGAMLKKMANPVGLTALKSHFDNTQLVVVPGKQLVLHTVIVGNESMYIDHYEYDDITGQQIMVYLLQKAQVLVAAWTCGNMSTAYDMTEKFDKKWKEKNPYYNTYLYKLSAYETLNA